MLLRDKQLFTLHIGNKFVSYIIGQSEITFSLNLMSVISLSMSNDFISSRLLLLVPLNKLSS